MTTTEPIQPEYQFYGSNEQRAALESRIRQAESEYFDARLNYEYQLAASDVTPDDQAVRTQLEYNKRLMDIAYGRISRFREMYDALPAYGDNGTHSGSGSVPPNPPPVPPA
jgi:hypothetical protein